MSRLYFFSSLTSVFFVTATAMAAELPDAGTTLQNLREAPSLPPASPALPLPAQKNFSAQPGGAKVEIRSFHIQGNSVIKTEALLNLLQDAKGKQLDFSEIKALADRITAYYHAHDLPFARAFIPTQSMNNGMLDIGIVEGHYGSTSIKGDHARADAAQYFLTPLKKNAVIEGSKLERTSLILSDQPGYIFTPVIRPGTELGTGDISFLMEQDKLFGGVVRMDNHGNRFTGKNRVRTDLYTNSLMAFGDRTTISAIYTEENMWYGSLGYSLPIGYDGLRANINYAHTYYQLGKEFSSLDAHGTADVFSVGASYPLIRSQQKNLSLSANYQHKLLKDKQDSTSTQNNKNSDTLPITLNFDVRDTFMGGGITYGALNWTHGILNLDSNLKSADNTSARTAGHFDKLNIDIARLQSTGVENLVLYARGSAQAAAKNLDSSEDFGLGGPEGVRAYPTGESYGDEGFLIQTELRYKINRYSPYIFYDYGHSKINRNPWTSGNNTRSIAGGGLGVRFTSGGWSVDALVAWRTTGGTPQSDDTARSPLAWVNLAYAF